jgi:peptidoglycan/LPS O-acetylase OafA/YrhL
MPVRNETVPRNEEVRSLTGLRGIAAFAIVMVHYQIVPVPKIYLAVDLFFVLSGFVMAMTYGRRLRQHRDWSTYGDFLWKRFARIYPLYLLATVVTFFLPEQGREPTLSQLLINLVLLQQFGLDLIRPDLGISIVGQGWSISAELAAYLLFPTILAVTLGASRLTAAAIGALAAIGIVALSFASADSAVQVDVLDHHARLLGIARCLTGFSLGVVAFRAWEDGVRLPSWVCVPLIAFLGAMSLHRHGDPLIVASFPVLILCAANPRNLAYRALGGTVLHFLGEISYAVYLLHILPFFYVRPFTNWVVLALHLPHARAASLTLLVGVDVVLATAALRLVEKPARRFLRRLSGRRAPEPLMAEPAAP